MDRSTGRVVPLLVAAAVSFVLGIPRAAMPSGETTVTATAKAGPDEQAASDPATATAETTDPTTGASATADAAAATNPIALGVGTTAEASVRGADTEALATAEQRRCFDATITGTISLFVLNTYRFRIAAFDPSAVAASLSSELTLRKNDEPPLVFPNANGTASILGNGSIDNVGLTPFSFFGAGQYAGQEQLFRRDVESIVPGDRLVLRTRVEARAQMSAGTTFHFNEASAQTSASIDFGLVQVPCSPPECAANGDCAAGQLCDRVNGTCEELSFAFDNFPLTTQPSPPAGPFSLTASWNVEKGRLQPLVNEVIISLSKKDAFNGIAATNQGAGLCTVGTTSIPVLTTLDANVLYTDVNGDLVHDPGVDVTITVTEDAPTSTLRIEVDTPNGGDGSETAKLFARDATVTCSGFFGLFDAARIGPVSSRSGRGRSIPTRAVPMTERALRPSRRRPRSPFPGTRRPAATVPWTPARNATTATCSTATAARPRA